MQRKLNWTDYGARLAMWIWLGILVSWPVVMITAAIHGRYDAPTHDDIATGITGYLLLTVLVALRKVCVADDGDMRSRRPPRFG